METDGELGGQNLGGLGSLSQLAIEFPEVESTKCLAACGGRAVDRFLGQLSSYYYNGGHVEYFGEFPD